MIKIKQLALVVLNIALLLGVIFYDITGTQAATLTGGSVALSTPAVSASSVTYTIDFDNVTASATKCIKIRFTDTVAITANQPV